MRILLLAVLMSACDDKSDTGSETAACALVSEGLECPECDDGEATCTYGEYSATASSCGTCQAEGALYNTLCDAGVTDSEADITAGLSCAQDE